MYFLPVPSQQYINFKQANETEHRHVSVLAKVRKHGLAHPTAYSCMMCALLVQMHICG